MPDPAALPIGILRCTACGTLDAGPRLLCPHCQAAALTPIDTPGVGRLLSWTVIRRPAAKFRELAPIGIAVVALDAGVIVTGRLAAPERAHRVDERVAAVGRDEGVGIFAVIDG